MATAISETADTFTTASKEFSQQGVCPYFLKETSRRDLLAEVLVRVYAPVVAGVIYLLHWLSDSHVVQSHEKPKKLHRSNQVNRYRRHPSLASANAF